jgi:radical SAM-linked protein
MSNYVLLFSKTGDMRFTSHLDLLRLFKRAARRAGLEISYSEGFNPHPKMSFAQPLSLGYEALGEILEFVSDAELDAEEVVKDLNDTMPKGIEIKALGIVPESKKTAAAMVEAAEYRIFYKIPFDALDFGRIVGDYLAQDSIICLKKQKKSRDLKEVDIRPMIRDMKAVRGENGMLEIELTADCGSRSNLSPELVISSFDEFAEFNFDRFEIDITREKLIFPVDFRMEWL